MEDRFEDIDKPLVDQAWAKMRLTLDKELPQEKRNRKFLFWLIPAAMFTLLIGAYFTFSKSDLQPQRDNKEMFESKEIAQQKVIASTGILTETNTLEHTPKINKTESKEVRTELGNKPKQLRVRQTVPAITKAEIKTKTETSGFVSTSQKSGAIQKTIMEKNSTLGHSADTEQTTRKERSLETTQPFTVLNKLKLLDIALMDESSLKKDLPYVQVSNEVVKVQKNNWNFGLRTSLLTNSFAKISSGDFGLYLSRKINPKLSIGTGLSYALYNSKEANVSASDNASIGFPSDNTGMGQDLGAVAETADEFNKSGAINKTYVSHYLSLPLFINYAILPRYELQLGASYNVLLGEKAAYVGYKENRSNADQSLLETNNVIKYFLATSYKCSSKFSIGIKYEGSLKRSKIDGILDNDRHQVGLLLNYRIR